MKRTFLLHLVLFTAAVVCFGQQPFIRTYYSGSPWNMRGACSTADDGVVLTDGRKLIRLDRNGNLLWSRRLSFSVQINGLGPLVPCDNTYPVADVSVTPTGDVVIVGEVDGSAFPSNLRTAYLIACFDSTGQLKWSQMNSPASSARSLYSTAAIGNKVIAGGEFHGAGGSGSYGVLGYWNSNTGTLTHAAQYSEGTYGFYESIDHVAVSADGGILASAQSILGFALLKLNSNMSVIWRADYSGLIALASAGHTDGTTVAISGNLVAKHDSFGTILWSKRIPAFVNGRNKAVAIRPNGNIVVLGNATDPYSCSYLVELDTMGNLLWSEQYGAPGEAYTMTELQLLNNDGIRMVGMSSNGRIAVIVADQQGQMPGCPFPSFAPTIASANFGNSAAPVATFSLGGISPSNPLHTTNVQSVYPTQQLLCGIDSTTLSASGTSFVDMDQDGLFGPGDLPVPWTQVAVSPQTGSLFTLDSGLFVFASVDTGAFTFTATPPGPWWVLSTDSASYTVHLDSVTPTFDSLDFGWAGAFDTTVVSSALVGTSTCTGNAAYTIQIHNQGTTRPELLLSCALDPQLSLVSSSPPVDSIVGNLLYWHVDSLDPFASWGAALQVTMPWLQNLWDTLNTTFSVHELDGFGNDTLISTALWSNVILCAYDPNDKRVEPAGSDTADFIWPDTEWLTYTIRFQNTGNATAQNVMIQDNLSPHLQTNTVQLLATSHTLTGVSISPYRQLVVRFDNIQLPDSGSDPLASQGFVRFRVKLQPGLPALTEIVNDAGIFFDGNPPVITEAVRVTLAHCPFILSTWSALVSAQGPDLSVQLTFTDQNEAVAYQWFRDGTPIPGALDPLYTAVQTGFYHVEVTDTFGCTKTSNVAQVIITSVGDASGRSVQVLPNPMHDHATIVLDRPLPERAQLVLLDLQGRTVRAWNANNSAQIPIDRKGLDAGLYFIRITGPDLRVAPVRIMME